MCFFLRIRRPPRSTRTDTLVPTRRSSDLRRLRSLGSRIMSRLRLLGGAALAVALGVGAWQGIEAMRSPGATPSPSTTPTSAVEQGTEAASDIVTIDTPRTAVSEAGATPMARSEERRVGKECVSTCNSRWSPYHKNKKMMKTTHYREINKDIRS